MITRAFIGERNVARKEPVMLKLPFKQEKNPFSQVANELEHKSSVISCRT